MTGQNDHRKRAEELVAAANANPKQNPELTALTAVTEAMLAVADEVAELRKLLTVRLHPEARSATVPPNLRRR